ncbi:peptidase domain-containing ABC transporter [Erwinia sp. E_sp_B01_3]|uniref:peptidase domain-containing ABC transporter n=1 Tax=unclassified Erwinia TaxID=2622719 RepID=UPI0030CBDE44
MKKYKTKDVIQDEVSECGLACISYICGTLGKKVALSTLRRQFDVTLDGLSFYNLMNISAEYQLVATGVQVAADSLSEIKTPAILLWNNCHFVVLKKVSRKGIEVMDPAVGSRKFTHLEVLRFFSGMALEIEPGDEFTVRPHQIWGDESKEDKSFFSLRSFKNGVLKYKGYMLPLAIMGIVIQVTNIAIPKFMSLVFDEVLPKNDEDFLFLLLYIFGFVYLVQAVGSYLKILLSQRLRRVISQFEGVKTVRKLFQMDLKFFNKRMPSDLLRKVKSVDVFHVIFTHGWLDIVIDGFFAVIFIVLLFMISFELALMTVTVTGLMVLTRVLLLSTLMSRQYSAIDAEVKRDNSLLQSIDNITMIKINHAEPRKISDWFYSHAELEDNRSSIEKINAMISLSVTTISHLQTLIIMGMGAYAVLKGESTAGQLISFIFYKNCLMGNVQTLVENHVNLKLCSVEVRRLLDISPANVTEVSQFSSSAVTTKEQIKTLSVKNLAFSYSNLEESFIKNINFTLNEGDKLVITGPSGCGKTTILNLLSGLLSPTEGEIIINDISLNRFGLRQYQSQISIVSPDDKIINGSVIENIVYESDSYDMLLLGQCIEQANLADVIRSLSAGLNTRLGINGARLSSGQQQRLMLARALYRRPTLILMDEPTSHLDKLSREAIMELVAQLPVSCIIVSHDEHLIKAIGNEIQMSGGVK